MSNAERTAAQTDTNCSDNSDNLAWRAKRAASFTSSSTTRKRPKNEISRALITPGASFSPEDWADSTTRQRPKNEISRALITPGASFSAEDWAEPGVSSSTYILPSSMAVSPEPGGSGSEPTALTSSKPTPLTNHQASTWPAPIIPGASFQLDVIPSRTNDGRPPTTLTVFQPDQALPLQPNAVPSGPSPTSTFKPSTLPRNKNRRRQIQVARETPGETSVQARLADLQDLVDRVLRSHIQREALKARNPFAPTFEEVLTKANCFFDLRSEARLTSGLFDQSIQHSPALLQFLYSLATEPLLVDWDSAVSSGVLTENSIPAAPKGKSRIAFYLRVDSHPTKASLHQQLQRYGARQGDPLLPAVLEYELSRAPPDVPVGLAYAGVSVAQDGLMREEEDQKSADASLCRRGHWSEGRSLKVFHVPALSRNLESALEWRSDRSLSALERLLVGCLGSCSLNSASGGFAPQPVLPPKVLEAASRVRRATASSRNTSPQGTSQRLAAFERVSEFEIKVWEDIQGQRLPAASTDLIRRQAASSLHRHSFDGTGLVILKDVTEEALFGIESEGTKHFPAFMSDLGGPAGHVARDVLSGLCGNSSSQAFDSPLDGDERSNPAFKDFWPYILQHKDIHRAAALLSLTCFTLQLKVVLVHSSKVWHLVKNNLLKDWCVGASQEDVDGFYLQNSRLCFERILQRCRDPSWKDQNEIHFMEAIGKPHRVWLAPGMSAVAIPIHDWGAYKRHPALLPLFIEVFSASILMYWIAVHLASSVCSLTLDNIRSLLDEIKVRADDLGITQLRNEAVQRLRTEEGAICALRTISGLKNSNGPEVSEQRSARRQRALNSREQVAGSIRSFARLRQMTSIVQDSRNAVSDGNEASLVQMSHRDAWPTELEWLIRMVTEPVLGSKLIEVCAGYKARPRDAPQEAFRLARQALSLRTKRLGGSCIELLTGAWMSATQAQEETHVFYCVDLSCSSGIWMDTVGSHKCSPQCVDLDIGIHVEEAEDGTLLVTLESNRLPAGPSRPRQPLTVAPRQRIAEASSVASQLSVIPVDNDKDILQFVESCGVDLDDWFRRDQHPEPTLSPEEYDAAVASDRKIKLSMQEARKIRQPRLNNAFVPESVRRLPIGEKDSFTSAIDLLTHPLLAPVLLECLSDQVPSDKLLVAPLASFLPRATVQAQPDLQKELGFLPWLKAEEQLAKADLGIRDKLSVHLRSVSWNLFQLYDQGKPFRPLPQLSYATRVSGSCSVTLDMLYTL